MPSTLETFGDIEVLCNTDELAPNKMARLVFRTHGDDAPPFQILVRAPSGNIILKRVIRSLPTGAPQTAAPITFSVVQGVYEIEIHQLMGSAVGRATLTVT